MKNLSSNFLITRYKVIEFEATNIGNAFEFSIIISSKCSHAGLRIVISLFGYDISIHIYDTRHWDYDYEKNCYYRYEKETL